MKRTNAMSSVREVLPEEGEYFRDNGWVLLRNFISTELADDMLNAAVQLMGPDGESHTVRPGIDRDYATWADYYYAARDGVKPFSSLARCSSIGRASARLAGRNVAYRNFADEIICRQPVDQTARNRPTNPHQDFSAHTFDRGGYVNYWIAMSEVTPEQGSLQYYSGSHREGPLGWDQRFERNRLDSIQQPFDLFATYPGLEDRYPLSEAPHLAPGDAFAHNMLVIHRATQNFAQTPRWVYTTNYIPADTLYVGSPPKPDGLQASEEFDHPNYPIVWTPS